MEDTIITTLNFSKACRACLNEGEEMHSIFSEFIPDDNLEQDEATTVYLYEILMHISSMRILADDGFPTLICTNCMELAHTSYKFQQQCNRTQAILEAYVSQVPCEVDESCAPINIVEIQSNITDNVSNEIDIEELSETFNLTTRSPTCRDQESLEHAIEKAKFFNLNENNVPSECEDDSSISKNMIFIKQESYSTVLKPAKTIISEDDAIDDDDNDDEDDKLCQKEMIRLKFDLKDNNSETKRGMSRLNFNFYVKELDSGEKVYACNVCDRSYKYSSSLKIHMRTHTFEKPYVCKTCGKSYKQYGSLMYHNRTHTGEQRYSCKICFKKYNQSGSLTAHMRVHTGQRPFLCSVCGRGFRQAADLGYHMRTHTKEKPYMCNVCGKTMSMQCHLVQHMRTHTGERPFKCSECNKAFPSTTRLKRHAIIHTGLKPYTCEVCDKSFNRRSSLRVHAKIHTDERPHVCPICGKGFIQAHALRGHVLTHSSEQYELKVQS